jgi:hypothetical protein
MLGIVTNYSVDKTGRFPMEQERDRPAPHSDLAGDILRPTQLLVLRALALGIGICVQNEQLLSRSVDGVTRLIATTKDDVVELARRGLMQTNMSRGSMCLSLTRDGIAYIGLHIE